MPQIYENGTDGFTSPPKEGVLRIFLLYVYTIKIAYCQGDVFRPLLGRLQALLDLFSQRA